MTTLVVGIGLAIVAYNEFRGRKHLLAFDLRGPRLLGGNQLGFFGLLTGYSLWKIHAALSGPNPYQDQLSMLGSVGDLYTVVVVAVYVGVILFSLIFQGFTALYYFTRHKHLKNYLEQTSPWIIDLQRYSTAA